MEDGPWWATLDIVLVHIKDQGPWVKEMYMSLEEEDKINALCQIGEYALCVIKGLSIVKAERDYHNNAATELALPVFPQQLAKMQACLGIAPHDDDRNMGPTMH